MYCGECGEECLPVKNCDVVAGESYGQKFSYQECWHTSDCCDGELFLDEDLTIEPTVLDFDD